MRLQFHRPAAEGIQQHPPFTRVLKALRWWMKKSRVASTPSQKEFKRLLLHAAVRLCGRSSWIRHLARDSVGLHAAATFRRQGACCDTQYQVTHHATFSQVWYQSHDGLWLGNMQWPALVNVGSPCGRSFGGQAWRLSPRMTAQGDLTSCIWGRLHR